MSSFWNELGCKDVQDFLNDLRLYPNSYRELLVAVQDATQEELDAIKVLKVAHFGDN